MLTRIFRLTSLILSLFLLSFASLQPSFAQSPTPLNDTTELEAEITDSQAMLNNGPHIFAGNKLTLDQTYSGNVYAAGGEVIVTGDIMGDLIVAGGSVTVDGPISGDIYAAGGTVVITSSVGGTVTAAGGEVRLTETAEVEHAALIAAGTFRQTGTVLGNLQVKAEHVILAGVVGQSATVDTDELTVSEAALFGENLQAEVDDTINVSENAQVAGEKSVNLSEKKETQKPSALRWSIGWVVNFLGRVIVMAIALLLFGASVKQASLNLEKHWPNAFMKGALFVVAVPILVILLMLTILGMPAAILMAFAYFLLLMIAWVVPGFWIGRVMSPKGSLYLQGFLGALVVSVVSSLPMIGWIFRVLLAVLGSGAFVRLFWKSDK